MREAVWSVIGGKGKRGVRQRDSRLERCPNPSWLTDASAKHLLPYCPAKLLLASYQGCRLEGRKREGVGDKAEMHRVMETTGTLNSLTQTIHIYHGKCTTPVPC